MTGLFDEQRAAVRTVFESVTGAPLGAFDVDRLTITERSEPSAWPFVAMGVGFGAGVVLSLERRFVEWAREHAPPQHDRAPYVLLELAREARRRGEAVHAAAPTLGWALQSMVDVSPPASYRLESVDGDWMREWQRRDLFPNALGLAVQQHRTFRNRFAFALFDASDDAAAVAGVYDTAGLSEIGVDVRREHRGERLAPVVVAAAARAILDAGGTAFYTCAPTNVRSQRTALAAGLLPVCSYAVAYPAGLGMSDP